MHRKESLWAERLRKSLRPHHLVNQTPNSLLGYDNSGTPVVIEAGGGITISGGTISSAGGGGTVTSVGLSTPTGLTVSGSPVTTSGTLAMSLTTGYSIPTTAKQTDWDTAFGWGNHALAGYASTTYVDNLLDGLKWKQSVKVATTGDITLSGEQNIDGVLTSSSRVLVWQQTNQTENGIYTSNSGSWTRTTDASTGTELISAAVNVEAGNTYADVEFVNINDSINLGVDNITFVTRASTTSHNNTSGLQGGTTNQYYHLTAAQHAIAVAPNLANISSFSTDAAKSLYTMTSTIPVEFRRSGGSPLLYLNETNGRIGIGIANPSYTLDVNGGSFRLGDTGGAASIGGIRSNGVGLGMNLYGSYAAAIEMGNINVGGGRIRITTQDGALYTGGNWVSAGDVLLTTGGTGQGTPGTTRLTILNSNGNVGIGTSSPDSQLSIVKNAIGVTQNNANGIVLANNTAAADGAQQMSPGLRFRGQGWKTDATAGSQTVDWLMDVLPVQGTANPTGTWQLKSSINGGAYTNALQVLTNGNIFKFGSGVQINGDTRSISTQSSSDLIISSGDGIVIGGANSTVTSGNKYSINTVNYFAPTSGTANYAFFLLTSTINQTGGANGITRGLYINPTLTSAADWRSIETSNTTGYSIYTASAPSYFGGNVIGKSKIIFDGTTTSSGAGAVGVTGSIHEITTTGTGDALTLADGTEGQRLTVVYVAEGAGTDTAVVTPTNFGSGTTITFSTLGQSARLIFTNGKWYADGDPFGAVIA